MRNQTVTGFTISTILRNSSAVEFPGEYYETLVFDNNDLLDGKYPRVVDQAESCFKSLAEKNHQTMVLKYSLSKP